MDLKFWKKEDDDFGDLPDFASLSQEQSSTPEMPDLSSNFSPPQEEDMRFSAPVQQEPTPTPASNSGSDVHTQLILARLDAITNKLDVLNSRLERVEQTLQQEPTNQSKRGPWYAK
ncbi:MAG: hypothetical protein ACMXYD_00910 [Candidatus Woesearchaeota archaeon]